MPRKKQEWTSCGGLVRCTKCGSDKMMMCDVPMRAGVSKRETKCESCGDRITTKMEAPQLSTPARAEEAAETALSAEDLVHAHAKSMLFNAPTVEADMPKGLATLRQAYDDAAARDARGEYPLRKAKKGHTPAPPTAPVEAQPTPAAAPPAGKIELLRFDQLHPDSVQPREQMDLGAIADYSAAMLLGEEGQLVDLRGDDWAPIVVYRDAEGKLWLADGFHRVRAARQAGHQGMQALVFAGTKSDALLHAVGANVRNGVRITNADKRRAVGLLLDDARLSAKTDTEIAALCCVSQPFVSKLRGELRQRAKAAQAAERAREDRADEAAAAGGSDNGYSGETTPAPLQFDIEETIAQNQRRQAEEEEEAAERRAEAEEKRRKQEIHDSWSTPPEFLETIVRPILGTIDLDPASNSAAQEIVEAQRWWDAEANGLTQEWAGNVWLNPPYSHPLVEQFAMKAIEEFKSGRVEQMLVLVNSATTTGWWHALAKACTVVAFPLGRIEFWSPHGLEGSNNRNSSTLFYFGKHDFSVLRHLREQGYFALLSSNF